MITWEHNCSLSNNFKMPFKCCIGREANQLLFVKDDTGFGQLYNEWFKTRFFGILYRESYEKMLVAA